MTEMSMAERMKRVQFLGREFLTWLLFRTKQDNGVFRPNDQVVEVFFERALTLEGNNPALEMSTLKVEDPVQSEEVMLSLRLGKQISRARLTLLAQGREYNFVLDGSTMSVRSLKTQDPATDDFVDAMNERAESLTVLEDTLHNLFISFIRLRIDARKWSKEVEAIRRWLVSPAIETETT